MATFQKMFSTQTTPSHDDFEKRLKAASNTALLLDSALKESIQVLAIGETFKGFHQPLRLEYQQHYAYTRCVDDPDGMLAWRIGHLTKIAGPGSQLGTINLFAGDFLTGVFVYQDNDWKIETPA